MLSVSKFSIRHQQKFNVTTKMRNKQVYEVKSHLTSFQIEGAENSARIETQVELLNERYGSDARIGFTLLTEQSSTPNKKRLYCFSYWVSSQDRHITYKIWNEVQKIAKKKN